MSSDPLQPEALLQAMADALPTHDKEDTSSDLSSSYEAIALFAHACMVSLGFRLLGFHEGQRTESDCQSLAPRLPSRWNTSFNSHSFLYAHNQSSMKFVIKVDRLGGQAELRGLGVGDERIYRLEITARDYVSASALPLRITIRSPSPSSSADSDETAGASATEDRSDLAAKLDKVFTSREHMVRLASLLKSNIIQKLLPGLQKEGYEEHFDDQAAREDADRQGRANAGQPGSSRDQRDPARNPGPFPSPAAFRDPLAAPARRRSPPLGDFPPPGFEDEHEIYQPPHPYLRPGQSPYGIGHDDLHPPGLGPHDPLRPSFIGGGGLPRPGGDGMYPTAGHPLFGGPHTPNSQWDPQNPPGARYDDPTGGGGTGPRFGGGRPGGNNGGFGGFGGFGGDII